MAVAGGMRLEACGQQRAYSGNRDPVSKSAIGKNPAPGSIDPSVARGSKPTRWRRPSSSSQRAGSSMVENVSGYRTPIWQWHTNGDSDGVPQRCPARWCVGKRSDPAALTRIFSKNQGRIRHRGS
ncbi:hypothetical protein COCNU_scaffold021804G000010 [Cocos nucifera]|nr:hypothetical protein [Cocos nucifera]